MSRSSPTPEPTIQLIVAVAVGLAGCGPATPPGSPASSIAPAAAPTTRATPTSNGPTRGASVADATAASQKGAPAESHPTAVPPHLLRPLVASRFAEPLRALGHDPQDLPKLETLSATQKLDVMKLMAEAVGLECTGCHVSDQDYRAETRRKRIARTMWNEFVVGRVLGGADVEDGDSAVFCDSCHQGSIEVLYRADRELTKGYMREQYAERLAHRTNAAEPQALGCSDCHGKPFQARIFEHQWGIAGEPPGEGP